MTAYPANRYPLERIAFYPMTAMYAAYGIYPGGLHEMRNTKFSEGRLRFRWLLGDGWKIETAFAMQDSHVFKGGAGLGFPYMMTYFDTEKLRQSLVEARIP